MNLTTSQLAALKAHILADPALGPLTSGPGTDYGAIVTAMNLNASPDFWCWRTSMTEGDVTDQVSPDATTWSWTAFIARSLQEQNGWERLWARGSLDASKANVRAAFNDIFSGGPGSAQRTHLLAISRRLAKRAEKVLASGSGSTASPGTFSAEGDLTIENVSAMFTG